MRYHLERPYIQKPNFAELYLCNHPLYNRCTLFKIGDKGLAVIQQKYDYKTKHTWWQEVDDWIVGELYLNNYFKEEFDNKAQLPNEKGLYPTYTVRQFMYRLKMKPLPKAQWETVFDHYI